jgi:hypothetical protein
MKKQDDDAMWAAVIANERANYKRLLKAIDQSEKRGTFVSIYDDKIVIDARNGGQWTVLRETGVATYASPAKRFPAVQTDMFK